MDKYLTVAVTVSLVVFALITQVNCSSSRMRKVTKAQILGFDWENCGQSDDPAVLKSLSLSPDPINIPGDLTASASGSTSVELESPLAVSLTVKKEVAGFWVKVPCVEDFGSCNYKDICDILSQLIPPGQDCPEPLHTYGLPCHCPFKAGSYSLPQSDFSLPRVDLPYWLTNGKYQVQGVLGGGGKELACLKVELAIQSD
ncbi:ganglioside GM2 activator [Mugil cephalus]|uniref:ganglioside GM2 activator n=1 Tax=Mugil cephalus TaxID=48193 RepID=UPI001FB67ABD|nr:ganglioside GM2 activator [Mugil cephalus]